MKIIVDLMKGKDFSKLVDYVNSPENIGELKGSQYFKVEIVGIGICSVIREAKPLTQFYGNIQLQVRDANMNLEEISGLMKLIHKGEQQ